MVFPVSGLAYSFHAKIFYPDSRNSFLAIPFSINQHSIWTNTTPTLTFYQLDLGHQATLQPPRQVILQSVKLSKARR